MLLYLKRMHLSYAYVLYRGLCGSAGQKAWAGDGIELELFHRVIIDYASNSTAAH